MNTNPLLIVPGHRTKTAGLLLTTGAACLLAACGPITPGHISPLSGTWIGANSPGGGYLAAADFDYFGHMDSLEIVTYQGNPLYFTFDGQPRYDINGSQYVARAETTLSDNTFHVTARIEYTSGKYEGVIYITVEGVITHGTMTGTIDIDFPTGNSFTQDFTASKN